ncbi:MAG: IPT/TIG domain-containing protein [Acidobacteriia bacterium]|nr:IPT/TIG domain-containing protein [Terriglobia bacterium]
MKRSLAGWVLALAIVWLAAGCGQTNNTFQPNTGAFISYLAPSRASAGGPAFTLTLTGAGFVSGTVVQWNGQNRPTTFVNTGQVTAAITAADIATVGTAAVNSLNPSKGPTDNGLSNTITFFIDAASNPIPTISSLSTTTVTSPAAGFDLTITGTNFMTSSIVYWNAATLTSLTPKSVTGSTQIVVTIPSSLVASAGTAVVSVFNPAPGGGTSNGVTFTITVTSGPTGARSAAPIAAPDAGTVAAAGSSSGSGAGIAAQDTPAISGNGRFVAYSGLLPGSSGGSTQIFLHDTCAGADAGCVAGTVLVSVGADGSAGDGASSAPAISADGRYVAFSSTAGNFTAAGAPSGRQIYLRDTCVGAAGACVLGTQLISTDAGGALAGAENILPSISASGRFVAFLSVTPSRAGEVAAGGAGAPNSGYRQVFVRDTCIGAGGCTPQTTRISLQPGDAPAGGAATGPALSGDARRLALAGRDATLFTPGAMIDDSFFHALIQKTNP